MRLPNKLYPIQETILIDAARILYVLEQQPLTVLELKNELATMKAATFIDALCALYALHFISYDQDTEVIADARKHLV